MAPSRFFRILILFIFLQNALIFSAKSKFVESESYPADPATSNDVCDNGGQVNANKGDCAVKNSGDRRFCL